MADLVRLHAHGIRVFHGRLYNHDYLWFSSNEISRVSTTQPILHNYALCYGLSQRSYRTFVGSIPKYAQEPEGEFGAMPLYATPAHATNVERTTITFNALDSLTLTTGDSKEVNTPNFGKRVYLNLIWEPATIERPSSGYQFYVFTFNDYRLPGVFRLGKKGCPVRVWWKELPNAVAQFSDEPRQPTHIINPLDVSGKLESYDPVAIPPHLLFQTATLTDDWFVSSGQHIVHVPKRVLERIGGKS
jgi:CRISPR-associated protein Csc1